MVGRKRVTNRRKSSTRGRSRLIKDLRIACELEHSLCCQYLYAAFSLRRRPTDFPDSSECAECTEHTECDKCVKVKSAILSATQRWSFELLWVAREEMSHLAMAINMLDAIGESSHLEHADYPDKQLGKLMGAPCWLQRCDQQALYRFYWFERPDKKNSIDLPAHATVKQTATPEVITIYQRILTAFETMPAAELFTGDGLRQVVEGDSGASDVNLGINMVIMPSATRAQIVKAVKLIFLEGEGHLPHGFRKHKKTEPSHYQRFGKILREYKKLQTFLKKHHRSELEPFLPAALNPVPRGSGDHKKIVTEIDNPTTLRLMKLFNQGYRLMLVMLREFFWDFRGFSGPVEVVEALIPDEERIRRRRVAAMLDNAFYPFMTMFIRPMGELLARQPAHKRDSKAFAGAPFSTGGAIPKDNSLAFYRRSLRSLQQKSERLAKSPKLDEDSRAELQFLSENLSRMNSNLVRVWNEGA